MIGLLCFVLALLASLFKSKLRLEAENEVLRHQLTVLRRRPQGRCVNALTGSAQLRGCFFEDDAGRAEDKRTGLRCPGRQAALAKQCLKRCANYASDTTHLVCSASYPNTVWHISFGDISDDGSARVESCGPPLRSIFAKKPPPG